MAWARLVFAMPGAAGRRRACASGRGWHAGAFPVPFSTISCRCKAIVVAKGTGKPPPSGSEGRRRDVGPAAGGRLDAGRPCRARATGPREGKSFAASRLGLAGGCRCGRSWTTASRPSRTHRRWPRDRPP
jgi:hypothetical protein